MQRFRIGVNYWPRSSAMQMWRRFDLGEIDDDFAHMRALGFEVVRFFLDWEAFQPEPFETEPEMLRRFDRVMERAAAHGLRTMPTLFTGHMSGVNWLPAWALDAAAPAGRFRTFAGGAESPSGSGDPYAGELLETQRWFARRLGLRARDDATLLAWDLGNEFSNVREPASEREAAHWSAALTHDLYAASNRPATGGIHGEDLTRDRALRPSSIAEPWAFVSMHGYSVYSDFARGRLDVEVVPFLGALAASFARKPLFFTELGNPACPPGTHSVLERVALPDEVAPGPDEAATRDPSAAPYACLDESEMATYAAATIDRLHARGALGALWWCWSDYAEALATEPPFDRAPHELRFGIVRADGSEKPVAEALARIARERRLVAAHDAPLRLDERAYYATLPEATSTAYRDYLAAYA